MKTHPAFRLSRRAFLRLSLLTGIGASLAVIYKSTEPEGPVNLFRWALRGQAGRLSPPSRVALVACPSYEADITSALRLAWQDAGAPDLQGARVVIKPNLVDVIAGHPGFTDPRVAQALIRFLRDEQQVQSLVVAEGMFFRRDPEAVLVGTGFASMLAAERVEFVDLNYDDLVSVPLRGGYARMPQLFMARTVVEADVLVSVPKLKTHHWTGTSASIKNLFGIVPGIKYGWPKNTLHVQGIPAFLAELLDSLPTPRRVAVVDGIVGMQGDGPLYGTSVNSGALIVGTDFLAVDATCARLMNLDPADILYLKFAGAVGLGQIVADRIQLAGSSLEQLRRAFQPAPTLPG